MAKQWYVVHTYSGHEDKVKNSIERTVENLGMQDFISQVLVPTEEVVSVKNNKKKEILSGLCFYRDDNK
jgi:transcriptional antiterminator NusG